MSSIPYTYQTPTPKFFFKIGFIDPNKENYLNRRKFIDWVLNNFYSVPWIRSGIQYDAYEFSFSIEKAAQEAGMTPKAFEYQLTSFLEKGWMTRRSNPIKNRPSIYKFEVKKFGEKVIPLEKSQDFQKENIGGTDLGVEEAKKGGTELKKGEPKREPRGEPIYETKQVEKGEPKGEPKGPFLKNDKETIESSLSISDSESNSCARENLSLSCKGKITAFFNPRTYRLRDGEHLSLRMQNALAKYSPSEWDRVLPNVQFYENFVDSGGKVTTTHERYLQYCIKEDRAKKKEYARKNDLYAKFLKADHEAKGIEILQTKVLLRKSDRETPESIDIELPPITFSNILENYVNTYYPKVKQHAY